MAKKQKMSLKLLTKDNYLSMIENACGAKIWANAYCLVNGRKEDILYNGSVSCAYFVSSILKLFNFIKELHLTVKGTEKDLRESGWEKIYVSSKIPRGSVLIWAKKGQHSHIGFYIGKERAISLWSYHNFPVIHHWTYKGKRKIIRAYWNPKIKN
ncbi:MAG: hypothetical protein PHF45_00820 [Candidatus Pacebacteria bacterium]|nr:hypothetical protein [Candidatus Paceibacterota bacterium]